MSVVVVGPTAVRGPGRADDQLISAALDFIDDDLALLDGAVVPAEHVWRDVLAAVLDGARDDVVLLVPSWWPTARVTRVEEVAGERVRGVVVARRAEQLCPTTIVEIAPELVVVHTDHRRRALPRVGCSEDVVAAVVACVAGVDAVTVDVPTGLEPFGGDVARALRHRGVRVTVVGDDHLVTRGRTGATGHDVPVPPRRRRAVITPRVVALAGAALVVGVLLVAALRVDPERVVPAAATDTTWLVEGRVAVEVPATWRVERITTGPGSARVQVVSPDDGGHAILVVQARAADQGLAATAEALGAALAAEPDGVFVDFEVGARRAGRPVVAYREARGDRQVWWAVRAERGVRIAIGCQTGVGSTSTPECDHAVASARALP